MVYKTLFYYARANSKLERNYFNVWDHVVFVLAICIATIVGFYYGYLKNFLKHKIATNFNAKSEVPSIELELQEEEELHFGSVKLYDYLLGSQKMTPFPVSLSLVAFYISGVTIMGLPTEVYYFGTQIWMIIVGTILSAIAVVKVYLPVFLALRIDTSYHYLEMRFNSTVRSIASFLFILDGVIFMFDYIKYTFSAIATNILTHTVATGVNLYVVNVVACVFCTVYTVIGGLRAIVHTNVWQCFVMYLSSLVLVIYGWVLASDTVAENAFKGGRLIFFNFNPSIYESGTIWSTTIGHFCYFTSYNSVNQSAVQRYMSLPSFEKCERAIRYYITGVVMVSLLAILTGLLLYDAFHDCDPLSAGYIEYDDQLLPLYMMKISSKFETLGGLLIAGLFCAALSTLSGLLNSIALVIMEDIVKGTFKIKLSEKTSPIILHSTILFLGCLSIFLVYLLNQLKGIFSETLAFTSVAASITLGIFSMGMLIPWTNSKGAIAGTIAGLFITVWIVTGQYINKPPKNLRTTLKLSVDGCPHNATLMSHAVSDDIFPLYRVSYLWINVFGTLTTMLVGVIVSFITKPTRIHTLDATLMSPVIHRFLPPECWRRGARSYNP